MKNNSFFQLISLMLVFFVFINANAVRQIDIHHNGQMPTHLELPAPADQPDVYYDGDNQQIIVDGLGVVTYYDVEIASATNWTVYISTQVSGSYGTIDISSLPEGEYVITIDSPLDNTYEGYFDTY